MSSTEPRPIEIGDLVRLYRFSGRELGKDPGGTVRPGGIDITGVGLVLAINGVPSINPDLPDDIWCEVMFAGGQMGFWATELINLGRASSAGMDGLPKSIVDAIANL